VRLFEVANPNVEECLVIYEARLKTQKVRGKAYLEMWCHFPDKGEFFSKDIVNPTGGTTDWVSCETTFWLKKDERPDRIKLNVVIEGGGMRGVISAGMALTLDELGLVPAFDAVYGASAGAITATFRDGSSASGTR